MNYIPEKFLSGNDAEDKNKKMTISLTGRVKINSLGILL